MSTTVSTPTPGVADPATMATEAVNLTIPDGYVAGMEMPVEWGGLTYNITVPDGVGPGQEITVELPAVSEAPLASPGMTPVTLTVPDGLSSGMEMAVEWGGLTYNIEVPEGVGPGQEITVELPSLDEPPAESGMSAAPEEPAPTGADAPAPTPPPQQYVPGPSPDEPFEMLGRRVELTGLVAKAAALLIATKMKSSGAWPLT